MSAQGRLQLTDDALFCDALHPWAKFGTEALQDQPKMFEDVHVRAWQERVA